MSKGAHSSRLQRVFCEEAKKASEKLQFGGKKNRESQKKCLKYRGDTDVLHCARKKLGGCFLAWRSVQAWDMVSLWQKKRAG